MGGIQDRIFPFSLMEQGVQAPRVKPKSHFNVQTLVYDDNTLEWLNYDAVMQRIRIQHSRPYAHGLTNMEK